MNAHEQKHSPEPWTSRKSETYKQHYVEAPHKRGDKWLVAEVGGREPEEDAANAQRIVSCVNACSGLPDPAAVPDLLDVCRRLVREYQEDGEVSIGCIEDAQEAIRKAGVQP